MKKTTRLSIMILLSGSLVQMAAHAELAEHRAGITSPASSIGNSNATTSKDNYIGLKGSSDGKVQMYGTVDVGYTKWPGKGIKQEGN